MNRREAIALSAAALCFPSTPVAREHLDAPFAMLQQLQPPHALLVPHLPKRYVVPVTLSGPVAEEIGGALDEMKIEDVGYAEVYAGKGHFDLRIQNANIPAATRDLLSGILNPVEMMETVLGSFLRYREEGALRAMAEQAGIDRHAAPGRSGQFVETSIRPKGERFGYRFADAGAFVREDWLTAIDLVVDTTTMLVHEMRLTKHERTAAADQPSEPQVVTASHRYVFAYRLLGKATVPARLELHVDGAHSLTITATYREYKGYTLFDTRTISYVTPSGTSDLTMRYGEYDLGAGPRDVKQEYKPTEYTKALERAAQLAQRASKAFGEGRLEDAGRELRALARDYPGTPQGVEARQILEGLRGGL